MEFLLEHFDRGQASFSIRPGTASLAIEQNICTITR